MIMSSLPPNPGANGLTRNSVLPHVTAREDAVNGLIPGGRPRARQTDPVTQPPRQGVERESQWLVRVSRRDTAWPGRTERWGLGGHVGAPMFSVALRQAEHVLAQI